MIQVGGTYQHYKGGKYEVLHLAHHTETKEHMVVYRNLEHGTIWARPVSSWEAPVWSMLDGPSIDRFTLIS